MQSHNFNSQEWGNNPLYDSLKFMYVIDIMNQADAETDEVYAQMTLQPVSKVGQLLCFNLIKYISIICPQCNHV